MNAEQYLSEVNRIIRDNFQPKDPSGGMSVATVAYLARRTLGCDQTCAGFFKFKEVLEALEGRGLIKTGSDSKGAFAVWLSDKPSHAPEQVPLLPAPRERFRALRGPVWFAFVSATPAGRRFVNRKTGEVRVGVSGNLEPAEEWAEITPVNSEAELAAAREFVRSKGIEEAEIVGSLESVRWYVDFPKMLRVHHPLFAWEWNHDRSARVANHVTAWCEGSGVDEDLVFDREITRAQTIAPKTQDVERPQLRRLLLAAIERLPIEDLLRLSVPARYLVRALRPDLLD